RALERATEQPPETDQEDPVLRVRGARHLSPRQVTALRAALEWRDAIARQRDRAVFRIVADGPLVEAVAAGPRSVGELVAIKGFPSRLAREEGPALVRRLEEVRALPESALRPYPKPVRRGAGRPTPEMEELAEKLKVVRNRKADRLGLPRGTLLANAVVLAVARAMPSSLEELARVEGMRRWKVELLGEDLLAVIRGTDPAKLPD
ncbi:MAG TPA: HRDC domain-containing protein, partial [Longimicrobiales bacterium]|nr:HRDC domain-containing protein [Longimicrobiales bacterium]